MTTSRAYAPEAIQALTGQAPPDELQRQFAAAQARLRGGA